jgi:hypothetical protein
MSLQYMVFSTCLVDASCDCLKSVMWEFRQLDADLDHSLSRSEVKVIDNNDMEPCLHPYLLKCDTDSDGQLSRQEWCCCFPQKGAYSYGDHVNR